MIQLIDYNICIICFENITSDPFICSCCNTYYHVNCIEKWSNINITCPHCREKMPEFIIEIIEINEINETNELNEIIELNETNEVNETNETNEIYETTYIFCFYIFGIIFFILFEIVVLSSAVSLLLIYLT